MKNDKIRIILEKNAREHSRAFLVLKTYRVQTTIMKNKELTGMHRNTITDKQEIPHIGKST